MTETRKTKSQLWRTTGRILMAALFLTVGAAVLPTASAEVPPVVIHPDPCTSRLAGGEAGAAILLVQDLQYGPSWENQFADMGRFVDRSEGNAESYVSCAFV